MKRILIVVFVLLLAFAMSGCGDSGGDGSGDKNKTEAQGAVYDPNPEQNDPWTITETAEEAARGAGFDSFEVMKKIEIDGTTFKDPMFAYRDRTAQATFSDGSTELCIRKGKGKYGTALTDRRVTSEFPTTWKADVDDLHVDCFGKEYGKATVIQWSKGDEAIAATYQGLNGEDVTMPEEVVEKIVTSVK